MSAVTFTASISVSNGIGEVKVSTMNGYDANKFSRRIGYSISGNFSLDARYTCWGALRISDDTYCSIGGTQTGTYNVSLTIIYV